jgi:hypothetical protein
MGVLNLYNELGKAQFERLSATPAQLQGRFFFDVVAIKAYLGDGTAYREFVLNTDPLVLGLSGTAANNVRLYTTAPGTLTLLKGSETVTPPVTPTNYANFTAFLESCRVTTSLYFSQVTPVTPAATILGLYQKTDGYLYSRDSTGTEWPVISKEVPVYLDWVQTTTPASPAASRFRTYFKSDGYLYSKDSAGLERKIGSGGGSGINYDTNPDIETAITGYNAYADAAGVAPVDGTGGSPSVTATRSTAGPLIGTASGVLTHPGSNTQGQGMSYDFTIDAAFKARQIVVSFEYQTGGGTYTAGDVLMYVVDVTNGTVIQLAPYSLPNSDAVASNFTGTFQASSNSTSYRLCWHCATTTTNSYVVKFDNVVISPTTVVYGAAVTDAISFTPTGTWSTNTTYTGTYYRVGAYATFDVKVAVAGAPTAATFKLNLPSGFAVDETKLAIVGGSATQVGEAWVRDFGTTSFEGKVRYTAGDNTLVDVVVDAVSGTNIIGTSSVTQLVPMTWAASDSMTLRFSIPIVGWGSNVQIGGYDGRTVAARANTSSTGAFTAATTLVYTNELLDTHSAYDTSTGIFTCPVAGYYDISGSVFSTSVAWTVGNTLSAAIVVNGTAIATGYVFPPTGSQSICAAVHLNAVQLAAGDTVKIQGASSVSTSGSGGPQGNFFSISLVPGRSTLAVGDTVATRAARTADQTGVNPNNTTVQINMTSVTTTGCYDRTGSYDTTNGYWTAPVAGVYSVTASLSLASTNIIANRYAVRILIGAAGAAFGSATGALYGNDLVFTVSQGNRINVSGDIYLSAGDRVYVGLFGQGNNSASTLTVSGSDASSTFFTISRVGN